MGYEIDYIAVGDGERSGDAIAFRYGDLLGENGPVSQTVVVIDGGTIESAEKLVERIKNEYGKGTVDYVICTHPDMDHLSGVKIILEKLQVKNLYIHIPWNHVEEIQDNFKEDFSIEELNKKLQKEFELVNDVVALAIEKGVAIEEPFAGTPINDNIVILGPTKQYYEELLCQSDKTPEVKSALQQALEAYKKFQEKAVEWVEDSLGIEILDDNAETSPENNSSVILLAILYEKKILFTGDAGIQALTNAVGLADAAGIVLTDLTFFHIPHHGSKHNLGNKILEKIKAEIAYVSASKDSPKHPSKRITNALIKNGARVYVTRGSHLYHHKNAPDRNWSTAVQEVFHERFQEE